jgi:hypothetical protein
LSTLPVISTSKTTAYEGEKLTFHLENILATGGSVKYQWEVVELFGIASHSLLIPNPHPPVPGGPGLEPQGNGSLFTTTMGAKSIKVTCRAYISGQLVGTSEPVTITNPDCPPIVLPPMIADPGSPGGIWTGGGIGGVVINPGFPNP